MASSPHPVLVDTSSLIAYCKTTYDEMVFQQLRMSTTNVCNEEVTRQKGASTYHEHQQACNRYLELLRAEKNPDIEYIESYEPYVENQGEETLETVFRRYPQEVKYILLFDFEAIERFESVKSTIGGQAIDTKISLPNLAFEILRRNGKMSDDEYCKATYQMGIEEGWMNRHALKFDSVSAVNCPQFP